MNPTEISIEAGLAQAQVMDNLVRDLFGPAPVCIECGRKLLKRGLCPDCRTAQEQAEIEAARSEGRY